MRGRKRGTNTNWKMKPGARILGDWVYLEGGRQGL